MPVEVVVFFNQLKANLKNLEAKRSYSERTIFDWKGKRMRRKLEKGYLKGLKDGLHEIERTYKKFCKELALNESQK